MFAEVKLALFEFHDAVALSGVRSPEVMASGRPAASTRKKFTRFCDPWWKPQQPSGLPECGKLSRSPLFEFAPSGSPSFTDAWKARMVSGPFAHAATPVQTRW